MKETITVEDAARICHSAIMAISSCIGEPCIGYDSLGESVRAGIRETIHLVLRDPRTTAEMLHVKWMTDRISEGWQYGPSKSYTSMQHPCLVPYSELPLIQKVKDSIFISVVESLAPVIILDPITEVD